MQSTHSQAFSLLDLVIAILLITVLSGIAVPGFTALIERNRMETVRDQFYAQVQQARALSIINNGDYELCGSRNGLSCENSWKNGWIIQSVKVGQVIAHYQLDEQIRIKWDGVTKRIRFHANGTSPLGNGRLLVCNRLNKVALQVVLNRQGRSRKVSGLERGQSETTGCD